MQPRETLPVDHGLRMLPIGYPGTIGDPSNAPDQKRAEAERLDEPSPLPSSVSGC